MTRKNRIKLAYQKQIRRVAIFKTLTRFKQTGENPFIRSLYDSRLLLNYAFSFKRNNIKQKTSYIISNVIKQTALMILLEKRLEIYTLNGILLYKYFFYIF